MTTNQLKGHHALDGECVVVIRMKGEPSLASHPHLAIYPGGKKSHRWTKKWTQMFTWALSQVASAAIHLEVLAPWASKSPSLLVRPFVPTHEGIYSLLLGISLQLEQGPLRPEWGPTHLLNSTPGKIGHVEVQKIPAGWLDSLLQDGIGKYVAALSYQIMNLASSRLQGNCTMTHWITERSLCLMKFFSWLLQNIKKINKQHQI